MPKPVWPLVALALVSLGACSSSAKSSAGGSAAASPAMASATGGATTAAPSDIPTVAPVARCTQADVKALDAAFLTSAWTASAPVLTANTCVTTVTAAGNAGTITLTLAPTGAADATVTSFRATPPPLPGRTVLDDLGVHVPSAGVYAGGKGGSESYLLVAAEADYDVSVEAQLSATLQASVAPVTAADDIAAWAVAQKL